MKKTLQAVSLTLVLSAPIVFSQMAMAQTPDPSTVEYPRSVAQDWNSRELQAYSNSGYDYWDARVLAKFWNQSVGDAKSTIGGKLLGGPESKATLALTLTDARFAAVGSVRELQFYGESGYNYDDASALAKFWGDPTPYEAKLRIERNLILGNQQTVEEVLRLSGRR